MFRSQIFFSLLRTPQSFLKFICWSFTYCCRRSFILAILAVWNMCVFCFYYFFFFAFWLHHVETCVLHILNYQFISLGNFLVVQWLGLCASNTGGMSSVPGWEAKIPHASPSAPFPPKFISLFFYDFWILYQT